MFKSSGILRKFVFHRFRHGYENLAFPRCFSLLLGIWLVFGKFLEICIKFSSAVLDFSKDLNQKVTNWLNSIGDWIWADWKMARMADAAALFPRFRRENLEAVKFRAAKAVSLQTTKKSIIAWKPLETVKWNSLTCYKKRSCLAISFKFHDGYSVYLNLRCMLLIRNKYGKKGRKSVESAENLSWPHF